MDLGLSRRVVPGCGCVSDWLEVRVRHGLLGCETFLQGTLVRYSKKAR